MVENMLILEAALHNSGKSSSSDITEESLQAAYMQILRLAREGFQRQKSALQCARWVESSQRDMSERAIVLSSQSARSSEAGGQSASSQSGLAATCGAGLRQPSGSIASSSSLDSLDNLIPRQPTETIHPTETGPPVEATVAAIQQQDQPSQTNASRSRPAQCPNYAQMNLEDLKEMAEMYGLRTNTSKRLLVHQLTQIWERMHKDHSNSSGEGTSRVQNKVESLHSRLRAFIRSSTGIFEDVLCYKVLDFERVYQAVNASVQCDRWMLRKFFDSEGIVYTSAYGKSKRKGGTFDRQRWHGGGAGEG
ncbi:hypothetical protein DL89DRAFT_257220 [Linderina pennispora]|uniref:Structure-specific endonuclease subunit SLX4 n=1 Tax=Linderina pennispora TaxID=61395 RepID=A0A1Y1W8Q9_9FUNG|nr:uncharacterized protein DL89DRAFT_257220 [Linderina pennispora]ORX69921.1 hypothetical protein DL89DRAFT_257220 [Linderina pennispora]